MASQIDISFQHHARYFVEGNQDTPKQVWFVLHGYGQLAEYFIRKFYPLVDGRNSLVVAPEGLSRFYLEGFSGRVGATWMTKEDRLRDIENYISYLNQVYNQVINKLGTKDVEITVLGFSQGAATATRWVLDQKIHFDQLVLWAGVFPDDMDLESGNHLLGNKKVRFVFGTKDPFLTEERIQSFKNMISKTLISPEILTFDGEHEIDQETLVKLV